MLRTALRQDPDVILVGEMRDKETVEIGLRAAITGHLVMSTLHTNDAPAPPCGCSTWRAGVPDRECIAGRDRAAPDSPPLRPLRQDCAADAPGKRVAQELRRRERARGPYNRALVGGSCANASLSYASMTVDIACTALQVNENGTLYYIFDVTSDARHGSFGNADFVHRTRRARLSNR